MANCAICGRSEDDTIMYRGIYDGKVSPICHICANNENVTLIKKPTREQLEQAQKRQSVKELMDKISSPQANLTKKDSMIAHKNLAKLHFPSIKQEHSDLVHNYDWVLKQARRHRKLSTTQVAEQIGVDKAQIESLEAGQIFTGFEEIAKKLEEFLNVKITKFVKIEFKEDRSREQREKTEKQVLSAVKNKMETQKKRGLFALFSRDTGELRDNETRHEIIDVESLKAEKEEEASKRREVIQHDFDEEKFDFSDKKKLENITIRDLAEMKKQKQEKDSRRE